MDNSTPHSTVNPSYATLAERKAAGYVKGHRSLGPSVVPEIVRPGTPDPAYDPPPDPTTRTELRGLRAGPYVHRVRPAAGEVGTLAEMLAYAMGDAEWPTWTDPEPLPVESRRRFIQTMLDDPDFVDAIRRLAG